ncbi:MAG: amidohydrolase family protein [Sphingomicrobium sp.]
MRSPILAVLLAAAAPVAVHAHEAPTAAPAAKPVPKEQLLVPPADADHYVIVSDSNTHGDEWRWTTPQGEIAFRKSQSLRGWITETDARVKLDSRGNPTVVEIRGVTPAGNAAETLSVDGQTLRWDSGADAGSAPHGDVFYLSRGGPPSMAGLLAERIVADEDGTLNLLPSGTATLRKGETVTLDGKSAPIQAQLLFVDGLETTPTPIWVDGDGKFLASVSWLGVVREGYEQHFARMRDIQDKAMIAATDEIGRQFLTEAARAPVLIQNVRLFDADNGRFLDNQSVLTRDGKIAAVGVSGSFQVPAGVRIIDGRGKSLVPGLWDAHKHFGNAYDLLANVATGMTSIRSPGNLIEDFEREKARWQKGEIVAPEMFGAAIVDQKHPLSAQGAMLVSSEAETIEAVRKIHQSGLAGVKFYTSMNPAWIAPAAAEAHRLGLHVSGHVPAGMRPLEAVRAGYDEVTHLNFIMMQAMPQSVVDKSNTAARFEGPAQYGKDVNLESPEMQAFIAELVQRGTWVDPTIMIFEGNFLGGEKPALSPAFQPYAGTLPAVTERALAQGGYPLFGTVTRDDFRASYVKMLALIDELHEAGVPIVAGTDGWGSWCERSNCMSRPAFPRPKR